MNEENEAKPDEDEDEPKVKKVKPAEKPSVMEQVTNGNPYGNEPVQHEDT